MANSPQARKRARQNVRQHEHNAGQRSAFRTAVKKVLKAIKDGDKTAAQEMYQASVKIIDRVADKRAYHKNKAARHKSRLSAAVKAMAWSPALGNKKPRQVAFFMGKKNRSLSMDKMLNRLFEE